MSNKKFSDNSLPANLKNKSDQVKQLFVKVANESYDKGMSISQSIQKATIAVNEYEAKNPKDNKPLSSVENILKQTIKKRLEENNNFDLFDEFEEEVEIEKASLNDALVDDIVSADFDSYGRLVIAFESGKKIISKKPAFQEKSVEQNIVVTNDYRPFLEMQEPTGFKTRNTSQIR